MDPKEQREIDNRANQLNPNNDAYYSSRGLTRDDDDSNDYYHTKSPSNNNYDDDYDNDDWRDDFFEEWIPSDND